jgi:hypothetical protein
MRPGAECLVLSHSLDALSAWWFPTMLTPDLIDRSEPFIGLNLMIDQIDP